MLTAAIKIKAEKEHMTPYGDFLFPLSVPSHLAPAPASPPNYYNLSPVAEQDHSRALVHTLLPCQ